MPSKLQFDEIGNWSEIKLDILKKYATAYSTILASRTSPSLYHVYIDAFAGSGIHKSKTTQDLVPGSPLRALEVQPSFREYHLIDINAKKIGQLRGLVGSRRDVFLYERDSNKTLLDQVFPRVKYEDYRRGLCILDPYGLHVDWTVIATAGKMRSIDMFLNFPVFDINRNVLWHNPEGVDPSDIGRMNAFWGDDTWREIAYQRKRNLFGWYSEKAPNEVVAEAFRRRLREVAGFDQVPEPLPMKNSKGAVVYYLFFGSQVGTAEKIAREIFKKYR